MIRSRGQSILQVLDTGPSTFQPASIQANSPHRARRGFRSARIWCLGVAGVFKSMNRGYVWVVEVLLLHAEIEPCAQHSARTLLAEP